MLWAYAHGFPSIVHSVEYVYAKEVCITLRLIQEACQHRDCRRLASAIVAKQAEDLISIHLHIESVHGFKPVLILLVQVGHSQELILELLLIYVWR